MGMEGRTLPSMECRKSHLLMMEKEKEREEQCVPHACLFAQRRSCCRWHRRADILGLLVAVVFFATDSRLDGGFSLPDGRYHSNRPSLGGKGRGGC